MTKINILNSHLLNECSDLNYKVKHPKIITYEYTLSGGEYVI